MMVRRMWSLRIAAVLPRVILVVRQLLVATAPAHCVVVDRLVVVFFMDQHRRRAARLEIGLSAGQPRQRPNRGRTCFGSFSSSVTLSILLRSPPIYTPPNPSDSAAVKAFLRHQRGIDHTQQQLFCQPQLGFRANLQVAVKVTAQNTQNSAADLHSFCPPVSVTSCSRMALSVMRIIELHCRKLELVALALSMITSLRLGNGLIGEVADLRDGGRRTGQLLASSRLSASL